jgi:hypothetical protein
MMSRSKSYENYEQSLDIPEECPMCHKKNADNDGEPLFDDDPAFCSAECRNSYMSAVAIADTMYYNDMKGW